MPLAPADLHMHTAYSDGRLSPTELVRLLAERGVGLAAISDHDSTEGLDEALAEAARHPGLRLIPAIEISADHPDDPESEVHILGYFLRYHDGAFQERLARFREERETRAQRMVERLAGLGYPVVWERVQAIAADAAIGRPHIARALVEAGHIATVKDAFAGLLDDGGEAYVARPHLSTAEAVTLIRSVGGAAVLAHPLFDKDWESLVPRLQGMGFAGMEVHYGEFSAEERLRLARLAEAHGLLATGGSDYHGFGHEGEALPGDAGPSLAVIDALERAAGAGA